MKRMAFSDDMMRALAAGEKTMTRRIEKRAVPAEDWCVPWVVQEPVLARRKIPSSISPEILRPPHKVGEIIAATCAFWINDSGESRTGADYRFEHPSFESEPCYGRATPARVMPASIAPFVLRITGAKAERLDEISNDDAAREGMLHWARKTNVTGAEPRKIFAEYWARLYGDGSLARDRNSWVWAYTFEVAERRI